MPVDVERQRLQLMARIGRCYQTIAEPIELGPMRIFFTRVIDPDRVLEAAALEEDRQMRHGGVGRKNELHMPYWAWLWDSSLCVATFLVQQWSCCQSQESAVAALARRRVSKAGGASAQVSVMDLGCGMGLVGTVAAKLGANVLCADIETPSLLFARLNGLQNGCRVAVRRINWQTDRLADRFDLILGADILYERQQWAHLDTFFQAHLKPGGAVLLGEPGRISGQNYVPWMESHGWCVRRYQQQLPGGADPIRLLELYRSSIGT